MGIFRRSTTPATPAATTSVFDPGTAAVEDVAGTYTVDASHSYVGFSARHAMVTTVRGAFTDVEGTATIDTAVPARSSVALTIQVASIDTGSADRDAHLQSADFFDAATWPTITFRSTDVERDAATWAVTGDLTIRDTTRPVTIEFEQTGSARDPFGNLRVGFEGEVAVNRKDWGLTWNAGLETGGVLVSEKVKLVLDISAIRDA